MGFELSVLPPLPSSPSALKPQHETAPPMTTHVGRRPVDSAVIAGVAAVGTAPTTLVVAKRNSAAMAALRIRACRPSMWTPFAPLGRGDAIGWGAFLSSCTGPTRAG